MLATDNTLKGISDCVKYKERLYLLYHTYNLFILRMSHNTVEGRPYVMSRDVSI